MICRRIVGLLGVLTLALAAGALAVWDLLPKGPVVGTLDLGAPISSLTLAPADGRAFALSPTNSRVFVLDVRTATLARTLTAPGSTFPLFRARLAPETADGRIFLTDGATPQHLYAAVEEGSQALPLAALPLAGFDTYLAVDAAAHRLFALSDAPPEGRLDIYDTRTQLPLPSTSLRWGNTPTNSVGVSDDTVPLAVDTPDARVVAGHLGRPAVSIFDAVSGRIVATAPLDPSSPAGVSNAAPSIAVDARFHRAYASLSDTGTVTTIDVSRDRALRTVQVGAAPTTPLVDERTGRVIVASLGAVSVLDARSGALVRTTSSTQTINHYPVAIDERSGAVYVAGFNGHTVDVFDGVSGRLRRSAPVPGAPEAIAVDDATGRVLVVVGHQRALPQGTAAGATALCALDGATGRLRRVLPLAVSAHARLYLDGRARRALVLLDGVPRARQPDPWRWLPAWLRARLPLASAPIAARPDATTVSVVDTTRL